MKSAIDVLSELESARLSRVVCVGILAFVALVFASTFTTLPRAGTEGVIRGILAFLACLSIVVLFIQGMWNRNTYFWFSRVSGDYDDPFILHCETTPPESAINGAFRSPEELPVGFVLHVCGVFARHIDIIAPMQFRHAWSGTLSHGGTITLYGREAIAFRNLEPKMALSMLMAFPSGHVLRLTQSQLRTAPTMLHGIGGLINERNDTLALLEKSREERDRLQLRSFEYDALMERFGAMLSTIALHLEYARAAKPSARVRMDATLAEYNNVGFLISGFQNVMDVLFLNEPPSRPTSPLLEQLRASFMKSSEVWRAQAATYIAPKMRKTARPKPPT